MESLEVIGILNPKLLPRWPTLHISSDITAETYTLPRMINLSWVQVWTLRRILRKSYWSVLVSKTDAGRSVLILPRRTQVTRTTPRTYDRMSERNSTVTFQTETASAPALYPSLTENAETKM